jgi:hypothetical protein
LNGAKEEPTSGTNLERENYVQPIVLLKKDIIWLDFGRHTFDTYVFMNFGMERRNCDQRVIGC